MSCAGPIEFHDQGILVCATCGECECCGKNFKARHQNTPYACFVDRDGRCTLFAHKGRECK